MNLFGRKPAPFTTPTVSTEQPEQQLGFWQKNRTSVYLFGGCILLLIVARSCNSHEQQAQKTQRAEHVKQDVEREQSDKDGQIADLHSQLFNAQRSVAAAKAAAETASPLTPQQMQQLALAGGTLPPAMFPSNNATTPPGTGGVDAAAAVQAQRLPGSYNAGEFSNGSPHAPDKPVTLVISYRQEDVSGSGKEQVATAAQPPPAGSPVAQAPGSGIPAAASGADGPSVRPDTGASAANHNPTFAPKVANPEDQRHQLAAGTGEKYRIREGTWLPCTEQLRINGFFAGNINCLISIPIYSTSGTHLLIPQGTVALGHAAAVSGQNQQRLFVVFDELIMPDGYTVNYDNAAGLDQIGQTGLRDKVDHHYIQMFGVSVGLAAIGGLSQIGNYGNSSITAGSQYRSGLTQGLSESSLRILDKFTNILPTFVIREGARNNIHLPFNLWLTDYTKHLMKAEL